MMERLLVILDMDETLVHVPDAPLDRAPEFTVLDEPVYVRPHARELFPRLLAHHDVAVWTASTHHYAHPILAEIAPTERLAFIWTRARCTMWTDIETRDRYMLKPIQKVLRQGYRRERVLFVDDTPSKLRRSYGNLVRVPAWEGDPDDDVLDKLPAYLDELARAEDVTRVESAGGCGGRARPETMLPRALSSCGETKANG